jgi:hypothetical protein
MTIMERQTERGSYEEEAADAVKKRKAAQEVRDAMARKAVQERLRIRGAQRMPWEREGLAGQGRQ